MKDTAEALALALKGTLLPSEDEPCVRPPRGGVIYLIPHAGGASITLYYERHHGDPLGVTSRAVWGRSADNLLELAQVAQALIARYERNHAHELHLSMKARFEEKQRP